jgi:nitroreductase
MDFNTVLSTRRTRKNFDPNHEMNDYELNYIIDAARTTPTSFNIQNWRFVAIRDRAIKEKIKRSSYNQPQIAINSILIIVCADVNAWKNSLHYWKDNTPEVAQLMSGLTHEFYSGKKELQHDEAMRSIGMAATAIMLAATNLGYSTNAIVGFNSYEVANIINLPENHIIGMLIAIGMSNEAPIPKTLLPITDVLIYDFFPC